MHCIMLLLGVYLHVILSVFFFLFFLQGAAPRAPAKPMWSKSTVTFCAFLCRKIKKILKQFLVFHCFDCCCMMVWVHLLLLCSLSLELLSNLILNPSFFILSNLISIIIGENIFSIILHQYFLSLVIIVN